MTLAVFLLPHLLDVTDVENYLSTKLNSSVDEILGRLNNNEDHRIIFSSEELDELGRLLHETVGVKRLAGVSWTAPLAGEMAVFSYQEKYFIVTDRELSGPMIDFDGAQIPLETFGLECEFDRTRAEAVRIVEQLFHERNGEAILLNGESMVSLNGELLPIPNVSCCVECVDPNECRHIFCIIDDGSSAVLGGYLEDKQLALGKIIEQAFKSAEIGAESVWSTKDERNARLFKRLFDIYKKKNRGGVGCMIRSESFFRLMRNLLEVVCKTIKHPEESLVSGFEVHPVCFMSDNVVDDFERMKVHLLSELGQDGDLNGPNEFGTIA